MRLNEYRELLSVVATREEWEAFDCNLSTEISQQIQASLRRHPKKFDGLIEVVFDSRHRRMADVLRFMKETTAVKIENQTGRQVIREALTPEAGDGARS